MCHIATRSERNFACGKIFPCTHVEGVGECEARNFADINPNAPEPSALDRRSQCNLNRSSQCLKEKARCARYADIKFRACAYACAHAHATPSERLRLKGCADRIGAIRRITRSDAYARGGAIGIAVVIKTIFHVAGDSANMIGNIRRQKRIVKKSVAHVFPSDF